MRFWLWRQRVAESAESLCFFCREFPVTAECRRCGAEFCIACSISDDRGRDPGNATSGLEKHCPRCGSQRLDEKIAGDAGEDSE